MNMGHGNYVTAGNRTSSNAEKIMSTFQKNKLIKAAVVSSLLVTVSISNAFAEHIHERADTHAPIGVMGDHVMSEGELMFSYRYMKMNMDGNREGTDRVSTPLEGFMVSPLSMDMEMHMLGGMYAPSDRLTLSIMVPVLSISMDHRVNMNGVEFTTESDGVGDITLASVYKISDTNNSNFLFNFGLNIPTGSIDEKDGLPVSMGVAVQLPYPMQTGSGTFDITPGLTYTRSFDSWSWGAQGLYTYRISENDNDYALGNKVNLSVWAARVLNKSFSVSARLNALDWANVDGADSELAPMPTVPTKNPDLRGGQRVDALIGVNYVAHSLNHLRFALEVGAPIFQDLDGPQLEADLVLTLGTQYTF